MMLRVARIDISKRKKFLASISKSNFSLYAMWKKTIYVEIQQIRKLVRRYMEKQQSNEFQTRWR